MPEVLYRMYIASRHSVEDLRKILNFILNRIYRKEGPNLVPLSAMYYFPEVFQKPKDEYMFEMVRDIVEERGFDDK